MIAVTLWRKTLVRLDACADGMALFDSIASMQPASDKRRLGRIRMHDAIAQARSSLTTPPEADE